MFILTEYLKQPKICIFRITQFVNDVIIPTKTYTVSFASVRYIMNRTAEEILCIQIPGSRTVHFVTVSMTNNLSKKLSKKIYIN